MGKAIADTKVQPGDVFGHWVVLSKFVHNKQTKVECKCECGTTRTLYLYALKNGSTKSCGCRRSDKTTTHGLWSHPIYRIWNGMMGRCYNAANKRYPRYGGRGISVCDRWHDVEKFIHDMYPSYAKGLQLERQNNDAAYSQENCRWATSQEQSRNRSTSIVVTHNGSTLCLSEWARTLGVNRSTVYKRWKRKGTIFL